MDGPSEVPSMVDQWICLTTDIQRPNQFCSRNAKKDIAGHTVSFEDLVAKLLGVSDQQVNFRQKTFESNS